MFYDHSYFFQGETTFVPRLVSLDLRGSLKTLCQTGTLYSGRDRDSDGVKWYVVTGRSVCAV